MLKRFVILVSSGALALAPGLACGPAAGGGVAKVDPTESTVIVAEAEVTTASTEAPTSTTSTTPTTSTTTASPTVPPPPPPPPPTTARPAPVTAPSPPPSTAKPAPACANGSYTNVDGNQVCRPQSGPSAPAGATARCVDGTYSFSQNRRGTCSGHGGVAAWL